MTARLPWIVGAVFLLALLCVALPPVRGVLAFAGAVFLLYVALRLITYRGGKLL